MKKKYTKSKSVPTPVHNTDTATQNVDKDADKALTTWLNFVKYSSLSAEKHAIRMSLRSVRIAVNKANNCMENCHIGIQAILLACVCLSLIFDTQLKEGMTNVGYNIMLTAICVISINMWMMRFILGMIYIKVSHTIGNYIDEHDAAYDEVVSNYTAGKTNS